MIQHLALALPVPLMLVGGRPVTLARRALAPAEDPRWPGSCEWLRDLLGSRVLHVLARPHIVLAGHRVVAFAVYFAGFYETARSVAGRLAMFGLVLVLGYGFC